MTKVINYTEEQTKYLIKVYTANPTRESVNQLADELGKTVKSIIGKLSREKVYQKQDYTTKRGEKPETKPEIIDEIAEALKISSEDIAGLVKSDKSSLVKLRDIIK